MTMDHVRELLSPYMDGNLAQAEKDLVEGHLAGCGGCREELSELRRVAAMVAALPKHPLPQGFLERVKAKREEEAAAPAFWSRAFRGPTAWEISPTRLAAVAACGIAVMVVVYRGAADRLGRRYATLSEDGSVATGVDRPYSDLQQAAPVAAARSAASQAPSAAPAVRAGPPSGAAEADGAAAGGSDAEPEGLAPTAELKSGKTMVAFRGVADSGAAARLAMPAGPRSLGGEPYRPGGGGRSHTNETLHSLLEKERERMGIREIVPASAGLEEQPQEADLPDRPLSKDEAMAYMRQMTTQLSRINRARRATKPGPVTLQERAVPKLLADKEESLPMEARRDAAPAGADVGSNMPGIAGGQARAQGALAGGQDTFMAGPVGSQALAKRKETSAALQPEAPARALAPEPAAAEGRQRSPAKAMAWAQAWSGTNSHMAAAGGAVIQSAADWTDLWGRLQTGKSAPELDFSKRMAVAVFGGGAFGLRPVEIVSVAEEGAVLMVRYRRRPLDEKADKSHASAPYHIVVVPRSELPPAFEAVE